MHARRKYRYSTLRFKVRSPGNPARAYSTGHARISAFRRSIVRGPLSKESVETLRFAGRVGRDRAGFADNRNFRRWTSWVARFRARVLEVNVSRRSSPGKLPLIIPIQLIEPRHTWWVRSVYFLRQTFFLPASISLPLDSIVSSFPANHLPAPLIHRESPGYPQSGLSFGFLRLRPLFCSHFERQRASVCTVITGDRR